MAMSESRMQQLLAGQSSIAQKVFVYVPIQDSWSTHDIHSSVIAANVTSATSYAVRRALGELKEAGLIREPAGGKFQRDALTPKAKREQPMPKVANDIVVPMKKPEIQALDALAGLSAEVVALSDDISARMKRLAGRIEEVALSVEVEREGNAEALGKLKQLQSLLKGIAE
jgi:hypothetical protein